MLSLHRYTYPPKQYTLDESHIDLYEFSLLHPHPEAPIILNPEELKRASRFYFERHRRRFATARTTVKCILAEYLQVPAKSIQFSYNPQGKPEVDQQTDLQFNLSHSGDKALLAVGKKHPLGVDIEHFSARPYEGIAKQLFSIEEQNALHLTNDALKPWLFFHVWSQKEAFIKACGLGLSYPTQEITVALDHASPTKLFDKIHKTSWFMYPFMPSVTCAGALCCHPSINTLRYFVSPFNDRINLSTT
jgi:4'-phosphopantetheinyl transferase